MEVSGNKQSYSVWDMWINAKKQLFDQKKYFCVEKKKAAKAKEHKISMDHKFSSKKILHLIEMLKKRKKEEKSWKIEFQTHTHTHTDKNNIQNNCEHTKATGGHRSQAKEHC